MLRPSIHAHLRDESGFALTVALVALVAMTVLVTSVSVYATRNATGASRSLAVQKARSLAEAGLNDGLAALWSQANPLAASSLASPGATALEGGSYTWAATRSGFFWTVTGTGVQPAPAPSLPPITRTAQRQVQVVQQPILDIWRYLYSDTLLGCMTVSNNATIGAPLYVRGNLCIDNNGHITGSPLQVRGTLTLRNNATVGFPGARIAEARIGGGCLQQQDSTPHTCTSSDRVYANLITSSVGELTKPAVDLPGWYANAAPGPRNACSNGSIAFDNDGVLNRSRPTFDLAPGTPYDCRAYDGSGNLLGQLTYTPGSPGSLVISGTVFFDGPIQMTNNDNVRYTGRGTIYSSSTILLDNNAYLCGSAACDATWNPDQNLVIFVAGAPAPSVGLRLSNNSVYQGGAYVVDDYEAINNSVNWGPVIADQLAIANNAGQTIPLNSLPPGAPMEFTTSLVTVNGSYRG
jgi:hypothetical protein